MKFNIIENAILFWGSDKYTEIKMCDLEPFSKIRSHLSISIAASY